MCLMRLHKPASSFPVTPELLLETGLNLFTSRAVICAKAVRRGVNRIRLLQGGWVSPTTHLEFPLMKAWTWPRYKAVPTVKWHEASSVRTSLIGTLLFAFWIHYFVQKRFRGVQNEAFFLFEKTGMHSGQSSSINGHRWTPDPLWTIYVLWKLIPAGRASSPTEALLVDY